MSRLIQEARSISDIDRSTRNIFLDIIRGIYNLYDSFEYRMGYKYDFLKNTYR